MFEDGEGTRGGDASVECYIARQIAALEAAEAKNDQNGFGTDQMRDHSLISASGITAAAAADAWKKRRRRSAFDDQIRAARPDCSNARARRRASFLEMIRESDVEAASGRQTSVCPFLHFMPN